MPIHLLSTKRLATRLIQQELSAKARAQYLAASFVIFIVVVYSGLASANPLGSWLSYYEAVLLTGISIIGVFKAYDAAGGESNPAFVTEFTCLYVPVSVTTYGVAWSLYWGMVFGWRESIAALSESHLQIAVNLAKIGSDFFGLLTFLTVVLVQFVSFYRIIRWFRIIREQRC